MKEKLKSIKIFSLAGVLTILIASALIAFCYKFIDDQLLIKNIIIPTSILSFIALFITEQIKILIDYRYEKMKLAMQHSVTDEIITNVHGRYLKFAEEYVNQLYELETSIFTYGLNKDNIEVFSHKFRDLRKSNIIFIPQKVNLILSDFERTLFVLSAEIEFQEGVRLTEDVHDSLERSISIAKSRNMQKKLLNLKMDNEFSNKSELEKMKSIDEIIVLFVNELTPEKIFETSKKMYGD